MNLQKDLIKNPILSHRQEILYLPKCRKYVADLCCDRLPIASGWGNRKSASARAFGGGSPRLCVVVIFYSLILAAVGLD